MARDPSLELLHEPDPVIGPHEMVLKCIVQRLPKIPTSGRKTREDISTISDTTAQTRPWTVVEAGGRGPAAGKGAPQPPGQLLHARCHQPTQDKKAVTRKGDIRCGTSVWQAAKLHRFGRNGFPPMDRGGPTPSTERICRSGPPTPASWRRQRHAAAILSTLPRSLAGGLVQGMLTPLL